MSTIPVRQGEGLVNIYRLDDCGRPVTGSTGKLVLTEVSEVTWEDSVDEGDQVTERNFAGKKCYSDSGCDELQHIQVGITLCGVVPAVDNFLLNSRAKASLGGGNGVRGFGRRDYDCQAAVALEVLLQLDSDACGAGSGTEPPVYAMLFPLVRGWRPSGGGSLNGSNLVKPQFSGKGYKNTFLASTGLSDSELPSDLDHWDGNWNPDEWYTAILLEDSEIDFPALAATASSDPQAFA